MHPYLFSVSVCHLVGGEGKTGELAEGKGRLCGPSSYFSAPMPPKRRQVGSLGPELGALRENADGGRAGMTAAWGLPASLPRPPVLLPVGSSLFVAPESPLSWPLNLESEAV